MSFDEGLRVVSGKLKKALKRFHGVSGDVREFRELMGDLNGFRGLRDF